MEVPFDQLPPNLQKEAFEDELKFRREDDDLWGRGILDEWKQKLEAMGFEDVQISYRGFWSQGDGASFTAKSVDIPKFLRYHKAANECRTLYNYLQEGGDASAELKRISHHYVHEHTVGAYVWWSYDGDDDRREDRLHEQASALENFLFEQQRELARQIYRDLENAYEAYTNEDQVRADLKDSSLFEIEERLVLVGRAWR